MAIFSSGLDLAASIRMDLPSFSVAWLKRTAHVIDWEFKEMEPDSYGYIETQADQGKATAW